MERDSESGETAELKRRMVETAPILGTLPAGTQVAFIQEGDEILLYNINRALELTEGRPPAATVNVVREAEQIAPRSSNPPDDKMLIDREHALTVDLSYPVLLLETFDQSGHRQERIIDGWHRIYKAALLGIAELPAIVITADEEPFIRIAPDLNAEPGAVMDVRLATAEDAEALANLRFRFAEESNRRGNQSLEDFVAHFSEYFRNALGSGRWHAVVAENDGMIVGHAYLEIVDKLPVPGRSNRRLGYVTNVYVEPALRNGGVGARIVEKIVGLGRDMGLESLVLWPTPRSVPFYVRHGFEQTDALELEFP